MNKVKLIIGILLIIVSLASYYVYTSYQKVDGDSKVNNDIVEIIQDGKVLRRIDLNEVTDVQIITVKYQDHYNEIQVEANKIQIVDADCPDKLCVNMGELKHNSPPLVCLPHHLVIQYAENNSLDTVAN